MTTAINLLITSPDLPEFQWSDMITKSRSSATNYLRRCMDQITDANINTLFIGYVDGKEVVQGRKKFRDDDPVWKASLSEEDFKSLIAKIVQSHMDEVIKKNPRRRLTGKKGTPYDYQQAIYYLMESREFVLHCDILGMDAMSARTKIKDMMGAAHD